VPSSIKLAMAMAMLMVMVMEMVRRTGSICEASPWAMA
jgi:hypothetical protein